jgi:elongation factor Ts
MKTLDETNGNIQEAKELLKKRGLAIAESKAGRHTSQGYIGLRIDQ